jgi:hypothetical protein
MKSEGLKNSSRVKGGRSKMGFSNAFISLNYSMKFRGQVDGFTKLPWKSFTRVFCHPPPFSGAKLSGEKVPFKGEGGITN